MTANDKNVLVDGLIKLAEDAVSLAAYLKAILPDDAESDGIAEATALGGTPGNAANAAAQAGRPAKATDTAAPARKSGRHRTRPSENLHL